MSENIFHNLHFTGGRPVSVNPSVARGGSIKRPASMPLRGSPTLKRTSTDRLVNS